MTSEEIIQVVWNALKWLSRGILHNASNINDIAQAILAILGGVCAISGFRYIRTLRKKTEAATFGYWQQLLNWLRELNLRIKNKNALVNNFYSAELRRSGTNALEGCSSDELNVFKSFVEEMLKFLKNSEEQMPAYPGWTNTYGKLITFLNECIIFDICDPTNKFKFHAQDFPENTSILSVRTAYCEKICNAIDELIMGIEQKQIKAETDLYNRKLFRLL